MEKCADRVQWTATGDVAPSRMAPNAAQSGKREVSDGSLDHCAWARSRAALNAALLVQVAMALSAAQSAIAAP